MSQECPTRKGTIIFRTSDDRSPLLSNARWATLTAGTRGLTSHGVSGRHVLSPGVKRGAAGTLNTRQGSHRTPASLAHRLRSCPPPPYTACTYLRRIAAHLGCTVPACKCMDTTLDLSKSSMTKSNTSLDVTVRSGHHSRCCGTTLCRSRKES